MSFLDAIVTAVFSVMILLALRELPRLWRSGEQAMPRWWLWGPPLWRGWHRALAVGVVSAAFLVLAFVSGVIADSLLPAGVSRSDRLSYFIPFLVLLGLFVLGLVFMLGIILVNRPKSVVPPRLRDERGAVGEWLGRRPRARP